MQETQVRSLGWEDPLEKEMATHSSNLAWKIPWMEEESGGLQSMWSQSLTRLSDFTFTFMDCSPQGSSVHGVFQARIVEWVAISSSRASSPTRDGTRVSAGKGLTRATEQYPERPRDGGNTPGIARSRPATLVTTGALFTNILLQPVTKDATVHFCHAVPRGPWSATFPPSARTSE